MHYYTYRSIGASGLNLNVINTYSVLFTDEIKSSQCKELYIVHVTKADESWISQGVKHQGSHLTCQAYEFDTWQE